MNRNKKRIFVFTALVFIFSVTTATVQSQTYDSLFNNERIMDLLINEAGRYIIKLIHPTCRHQSTTLSDKSSRILKFKTLYKCWSRGHRLVWMIELSPRTIISDFRFISDTSRFPSARFANRLKNKIVQLIKYYYNKYIK